jgi:hypothetical protein
VKEDIIDQVEKYLGKAKDDDQLQVNWEYLEEVQRTKNLRRINFVLNKEQLMHGGAYSVNTHPHKKNPYGAHHSVIIEELPEENLGTGAGSDGTHSESMFNKTEISFPV